MFFEKQILVVKLIITTEDYQKLEAGEKKPLLEQICIERWLAVGFGKLNHPRIWARDLGSRKIF